MRIEKERMKMKPRNHVAAAKQSGAGKHKQADKTAIQEAFERAMYRDAVKQVQLNAPNNVRGQ